MLASALQFAGYDVQFDWSDGGHNVTRATEIFSQVMKWMWRDWPAAPTVGSTNNDFLKEILIEGDEGWIRVADGMPGDPVTRIIYPDLTNVAMIPTTPGNTVWQYLLQDGKVTYGEPFYWLHNDDSRPLDIQTITFDGKGNLWAVTGLGIQICDQNGRVRAILRLPRDIDAVNEIDVSNGFITLSTDNAVWQRRLNVVAPNLGIRPDSQGQG
jgi:hypothetical protein